MVDWLKANPAFSMEDYMWKLSVPMAKIMAADATHTIYLSEKQAKKYNIKKNAVRVDSIKDMMTDLGTPVFKKKPK